MLKLLFNRDLAPGLLAWVILILATGYGFAQIKNDEAILRRTQASHVLIQNQLIRQAGDVADVAIKTCEHERQQAITDAAESSRIAAFASNMSNHFISVNDTLAAAHMRSLQVSEETAASEHLNSVPPSCTAVAPVPVPEK